MFNWLLSLTFRGLRPLLNRWQGKGFGRDLRKFILLLESGSAQRAEVEVFICMWLSNLHQTLLLVIIVSATFLIPYFDDILFYCRDWVVLQLWYKPHGKVITHARNLRKQIRPFPDSKDHSGIITMNHTKIKHILGIILLVYQAFPYKFVDGGRRFFFLFSWWHIFLSNFKILYLWNYL